MAFRINAIEPVYLGDKKLLPKLTQEIKMRIGESMQNLQGDDRSEIINAIAEAFPNDTAFVKDYLTKVFDADLVRLATYLTGGETAVRQYDGMIERKLDKIGEEE